MKIGRLGNQLVLYDEIEMSLKETVYIDGEWTY